MRRVNEVHEGTACVNLEQDSAGWERSDSAVLPGVQTVKYVFSLITLMGTAGTAHASLIFALTPTVYRAAPGDTIHTFATVTNTGPEVLYYAYSFLDPGTVPIAGGTGQLPPAILQPGDRIYFVGATITTNPMTNAGAYTFIEGVGYHPGLGVLDVVEAKDVGTLVVVPEPAPLFLCGLGFLTLPLALWRRA